MRALSIAATGMNAQQTNLDVIANNIANINTTGFKRARAEFTDLIYQSERAKGVPSRSNQDLIPEGSHVGLGVRTAAIRSINTQGSLTDTGNQLDVALTGSGWFQVTVPNGETLYSRSGAFNTNASGQLVTTEGHGISPAITIPTNAVEVIINETGQVFARVEGQTELDDLGQLTLAVFANDAGLIPTGGSLFAQSAASGAPTLGAPGEPGFATMRQGYLEDSNVDPVKEITELIAAQRSYEMNSKVIQAADEMSGVVSKGLR
ncbi:MAG: flagellar basal-body rod protein FlgG [Rhizobiaceae bacterium]